MSAYYGMTITNSPSGVETTMRRWGSDLCLWSSPDHHMWIPDIGTRSCKVEVALVWWLSWLSTWQFWEWIKSQKERGHLWTRARGWGGHRLLIRILAWRYWSRLAMKSLGPGKVYMLLITGVWGKHIWVHGQPGTKQVTYSGVLAHICNPGYTFYWRPTYGHWKKEDSLFFTSLY